MEIKRKKNDHRQRNGGGGRGVEPLHFEKWGEGAEPSHFSNVYIIL